MRGCHAFLSRALIAISLVFLASALGTPVLQASASISLIGDQPLEMAAAGHHEKCPVAPPASGATHNCATHLGLGYACCCASGVLGCCISGLTAVSVFLCPSGAAQLASVAGGLRWAGIFPEAIYRPPRLA